MPVPGSLLLSPTTGVALVQTLLLALAPHGGQHVARRNAWAGMAADAQQSRSRREAAAAIERAVDVAAHRRSAAGIAREG